MAACKCCRKSEIFRDGSAEHTDMTSLRTPQAGSRQDGARTRRPQASANARLAERDRVKVQLVKLRCFVGLSIPEAGPVLGLSESTGKRYWTFARAWLYDELKGRE